MSELKVKFLVGPCSSEDRDVKGYCENFLNDLSSLLGEKVSYGDMEEVKNQPLPVYFIATGGSERQFMEVYEQTQEPYILLTTQANNSLAASMEILGYLQDKGLKGEILHGSTKSIADRLRVLRRVAETKKALKGKRLGCFGGCEALISSAVDFDMVRERSGIEMVYHEVDEVIEEFRKGGYPENEYTKALKEKSFDPEETEKALCVYGAMKRLVEKYNLDAVTVKCFDLLTPLKTTGCLALAILNAEGIPAACEGDQKSAISMLVLKELTGNSGFMANPSCMDPAAGEIIFAHCTLPLDFPDEYALTTHFESGTGVAVTSDLAPQVMTIFKCDGSFRRYYADRMQLVETMHRKDLCRSQMRLRLENGTSYFSNNPISNHHIICKGDWKEVIDEFFSQMK